MDLEVQNNSEEEAEAEAEHSMAHFLEEHNLDIELPTRGEIRDGVIVSISSDEMLVDIGAKSEGIIPSREVLQLSDEERAAYTVGSDIRVYIVNPDNHNNILLSITKAQEDQNWRDAETLLEAQEVYEGKITGYNKGGLIMHIGRLRGFIPGSQMSPSRQQRSSGETAEQKWAEMVQETTLVKVIEVDRRRNRLILSERAAAREARARQREVLMSELQRGEKRTGRVSSLANFGAFVDLGGAEGLVHLSELSWQRVTHPRDLLKVGDQVEVEVLNIDHDRKRIALSIKRLQEDPWHTITKNYDIGQLVEGTITKLTKFGAFAQIQGLEAIEGLIHISELSDSRIAHPKEVVAVGENRTLRIIKIDADKRRLGLSLKEVTSSRYIDQDLENYQSYQVDDDVEIPPAVEPEATEEEATDEVAEDVTAEADVEVSAEVEVEEEATEVDIEEPTSEDPVVEGSEVETEADAGDVDQPEEANSIEAEPNN